MNFTKKNIAERLKFEINGYTQPIKKIYGINSKIYKKVFSKIFFSYIINWIGAATKILTKREIKKIIYKNSNLFPNFLNIRLILFVINVMPLISTFYILKIIEKINSKIYTFKH
jgi:hypothetical protein